MSRKTSASKNQGRRKSTGSEGNIKTVAKVVDAMPKAPRNNKHGRNISIGRK